MLALLGLRWGELCEPCPGDLLDELNGEGNDEKITVLLKRYRHENVKPRPRETMHGSALRGHGTRRARSTLPFG